MSQKVLTMTELAEVTAKLKSEGKKIVHCHGVFDLIHPGHIKHFEAAKRFGDVLVVTITEDKYVNKGPGRPIFTETLRAENLSALESINFVAINFHPLALPALESVKPHFYVKGQDYKNAADDITGGIVDEKNKVEEHGGKLVFTEEIQFSSSSLINRHIDQKPKETKHFIKQIKRSSSYDKLKAYFDKISNYKVLIIGDIILDEYQFVDPLGKSSKSATITAKRLNSELYAADFVKEVKLISTYGVNYGKNYLEFMKRKLNKNIDFNPVYTPDRPTTLKRRLLSKTFNQKFFEVIEIEDHPIGKTEKEELIKQLDQAASEKYDAILVADFGHGIIDKEIVNHLCKLDTFLAINVQTNSANKGYNLITKYPKCDYFTIDKEEARLAVHDKFCAVDEIHDQLLKINNAKIGSITLGTQGCSIKNQKSGDYIQAPVLNNEIVDTIGAGDAFFSITSLLAKDNVPVEEIAFVGNAIGAMAVKIMGNKSFIQKIPLLKYLKTLLT